MKNLIIALLVLLSSLSLFSCNTPPVTVVSIISYNKVVQVPVSSTTVKDGPNNKPIGTVVGVAAGEWLIGGPVGWIIGGALGHAAASDGTVTRTIYRPDTVTLYHVRLSNGTIITSEDSTIYKVGEIYHQQ